MPQQVRIADQPRGEDFQFKFRKGEWAETLLVQTLNRHDELVPIQYGVSRDDTLYSKAELDRVKEPGVNEFKRPDILVFTQYDLDHNDNVDTDLLLEYHNADPDNRKNLLPKLEATGTIGEAIMAIEAEASRFNISKRNNHYSSLSTYVKKEDYPRLGNWKLQFPGTSMFVCQLFYDRGYIVPFAAIEQHADECRQTGNTSVPGFTEGIIPGIEKPGYRVILDSYMPAVEFGEITDQPAVVKGAGDNVTEVNYSWSSGGQLESPRTDPHFHDGAFENSAVDCLARYALQ